LEVLRQKKNAFFINLLDVERLPNLVELLKAQNGLGVVRLEDLVLFLQFTSPKL